jgi:hypothetical protein
MPITPHLVEQAASFLQSSSATPKEKLAIGGKMLWGATMISRGWTPELLGRARTAYKILFNHGSIKRTMKQMDEKDASRYLTQFTEEVTQLATDIEQARSQQPRPRKS